VKNQFLTRSRENQREQGLIKNKIQKKVKHSSFNLPIIYPKKQRFLLNQAEMVITSNLELFIIQATWILHHGENNTQHRYGIFFLSSIVKKYCDN